MDAAEFRAAGHALFRTPAQQAGMMAEGLDAAAHLLPAGFLNRLARQLDRRHFLELDCAVLDEIVERRVGRTRDLHAVEVHGERGPVIGVGPGRGQADALHAGRHPVLFLIEALLDVRAVDAAVLGGPVHCLFQIKRRADRGGSHSGSAAWPGACCPDRLSCMFVAEGLLDLRDCGI